MTLVSRDPFARTELHKTSFLARQNEGCKFCGGTSGKKGLLFNFRTESDGGRVSHITGEFCGIRCMKAYHNPNI